MQRVFGCRLHDEALLAQALSHRSVGARNNERLEFLGDSALGYAISECLYRRFPGADEGQLSRLRVALVKGSALAALARDIELGEHLRLGRGEKHAGGRRRDSILADTFEALIGAIALDLGLEACREAVLTVFASRLDDLRPEEARKDPKTRLQELLQAQRRPLPVYRLLRAEGQEHARKFTVSCALADSREQAQGEGRSRRSAEQLAAEHLLEVLAR